MKYWGCTRSTGVVHRVLGLYTEYWGCTQSTRVAHGVPELHMDYQGCTQSTEMYKTVCRVQAYDNMCDIESPKPYPYAIPLLFVYLEGLENQVLHSIVSGDTSISVSTCISRQALTRVSQASEILLNHYELQQ